MSTCYSLQKTVFFLMCMLGVSGCATHYEPIVVPVYTGAITVHSSSATVSTFTEIPAGDYLVTNSQVFLTGRSNLSKHLGLLGVIIGQSKNSVDFGSDTETLSVKFDEVLSGLIHEKTLDKKFKIVNDIASANLVFLPSAKLILDQDDEAKIEFRLTVRIVDPVSNMKTTKDYYFFNGKSLPIKGDNSWSSDEAANLIDYSRFALGNLIKSVSFNLFGDHKDYADIKLRKYIHLKFPYSEKPLKVVLLNEEDDYLVVSNEDDGVMVESTVLVVSKNLLHVK